MNDRTSRKLGWAIPVMRVGYGGRGLVYLAVAGASLYSLWRGGQAQDTGEALDWLNGSWGGGVLLFLILLGMLAYAVWRVLDAVFDLEDYGTDAKGITARLGMIFTGAAHLAIGITAFSLLFAGSDGEEGSSIPRHVGMVMAWPFGRWLVALAAVVIVGAGGHYLRQGWRNEYRKHLQANRFTTRWNMILKAGVMAQGAVIAIVGLLFAFAAWRVDPSQAGGVGEAFSWLAGQSHGRILVIAICLGLGGFAVFCFVNAAYRIVPKVAEPDLRSLADLVR
ncbi:DUF1206 domain-containing protein [Paracoccus sp. ME4]|uniref:DUF1206 domain-containing protein n=1 Tax=Paracoccus sp. ME4 TaxID=3138066 RepID=UPI00398B94D4